MQLDTPTLYTSITIAAFAGAFVLIFFMFSLRHRTREIGWSCLLWAFGMLFIAVGTLLTGMRGTIPNELSIVVSNILILWGVWLRPIAVSVFFNKRTFFWVPLGLSIVWTALCQTSFFQEGVHYRVFYMNGSHAIAALFVIWMCYRFNSERLVTARVMAGAFAFEAFAFLLFINHHAFVRYTNFMEAFGGTVTTVYLVLILMTIVVSTMAIAAMCIERIQNRFHEQAMEDMLTGLPNRRAFYEAVEKALTNPRAEIKQYAVVLLDIDHFKKVNDTFGHAMGDAILRLLGLICREAVPATGLSGRIGGEEFAIFLPNTTEDTAGALSHRISQRLLVESATASDKRVEATISAGVVICPAATPFDLAVEGADKCLYDAKRQGRNRTIMHDRTTKVTPERTMFQAPFASLRRST
ncbi:diguanylate cyclase (GGDEF)-like protein [Roseibium hamelinense]|uniref:diguanylate cyclase n=1 Tax=Roseibium hamelinense TaxID=150831 RepID=A0A562T8F9_9HYPH|nr:GGDEF domain-containing protein [Roseibium hamelinense]MTI42799.1 GGDEF domain-containing protein [Roseibium hamelinense]TWI89464.1 diguanylate cyclase (GGDEF)-like protein [Roseibium hamelinense]